MIWRIDMVKESFEFNHGDRVKTKDGSGYGMVLAHAGKNSYGDNLILVKWDNGKEYPIAQTSLVHESKCTKAEEGKIDYNYWYKFDKKIPHVMRFKEFHIIDDHILYWITQEYFEETDVRHFFDVFEDMHSYTDTAFVICRDETSWDYEKDLKDGTGAFMTLKDGYTMWNESIEVKEDFQIPGTEIILEKGDKIKLLSKKDEATNSEVVFEDSNFVFKKIKMYAAKDGINFDEEVVGWSVDTKPHSKADDYVISIYIDCDWNHLDVAQSVVLKYGMRMGGKSSITEFMKVLQDSLKFADKVASYLKVKVANR